MLVPLLDGLLYGCGAVLFVGLGYSAFVSWREGEARAAGRLLLLTLLLPLPYLGVVLLPGTAAATTGTLVLAVTLTGAVAVLWPTGATHRAGTAEPTTRFDERDVMFSRARLVPGTDRFRAYYEEKPEHFEPDERFRALVCPMQRARDSHRDPNRRDRGHRARPVRSDERGRGEPQRPERGAADQTTDYEHPSRKWHAGAEQAKPREVIAGRQGRAHRQRGTHGVADQQYGSDLRERHAQPATGQHAPMQGSER